MTGVPAIDPLTVGAVIAAFFIGGFVKGIIGFGILVVVMVILVQVMTVADAIAVLMIPGIVSNVWQATRGPWMKPLLRRLWPFLTAAMVGTVAGAMVLAGTKSGHMTAFLGLVLTPYSLYALIAPRLPEPGRREAWMAPAASGSGGVLFGMTGIFIVPGILYLETLRLPRDQFVQALGMTFITLTATMVLALTGLDLISDGHMILALIAIGPTFAGMWAGSKLRNRISEDGFRKVFFIALAVAGVHMVARSGLPF